MPRSGQVSSAAQRPGEQCRAARWWTPADGRLLMSGEPAIGWISEVVLDSVHFDVRGAASAGLPCAHVDPYRM